MSDWKKEPQKSYSTFQEAFNDAYIRLLKQGVPGHDFDKEECQYRTSEGYACAVGCLISDETFENLDLKNSNPAGVDFYCKSAKGKGVELTALLLPEHTVYDAGRFLEALQNTHDGSVVGPETFSKRFKAAAAELAKSFGLTIPEV